MSQNPDEREGYDPKATALGGLVAFAVILFLTKTPMLVAKYPSLLKPIFFAFPKPEGISGYLWFEAPLKLLSTSGIIAIAAGALVAGILAPGSRSARSGEGAGYAVYWYCYFTMFPERPGVVGIVLSMFFMYGFLGFFFGRMIGEMKKNLAPEE